MGEQPITGTILGRLVGGGSSEGSERELRRKELELGRKWNLAPTDLRN